jgi:DNA-binding transcriptional regulator LsrR (DeoR family)
MNVLQRRIITKIAYLYYIEGKSQKEISQELDIYRTTVGRMLRKAQREGIIAFNIKNYDTELFAIESRIKDKYDLNEAIVVPDDLSQSLAEMAVQYLKKIIEPGDVVGVSWGKALENMVDGVRNISDLDACFVPLAGAPSEANSQYHVNGIIYDLAQKFNSRSVYINAAAVQPDVFAAQKVYRSAEYLKLKSYWQKMKIAVVGIGGPLTSMDSSWRDLLTAEDVVTLRQERAVGDCCCHFFNQKGEIIDQDLERRLVACPIEQFPQVDNVIGLAGSLDKVESIKTLLKMGLLDTLITSRDTAEALLQRG